MKRTTEAIFEKGGFIRKLENLGTRELPFKISEHGLVHKIGSSFVIKFDVKPQAIDDLREELGRDVDVVRRHVFRLEDGVPEVLEKECTLHEELLPPAYRKEVIKMMEIGKKGQKPKYPHNSGLDYYPFQK